MYKHKPYAASIIYTERFLIIANRRFLSTRGFRVNLCLDFLPVILQYEDQKKCVLIVQRFVHNSSGCFISHHVISI